LIAKVHPLTKRKEESMKNKIKGEVVGILKESVEEGRLRRERRRGKRKGGKMRG